MHRQYLKSIVFGMMLFSMPWTGWSVLTEDNIKDLERSLDIVGVRDDTFRNDDRKKFEVLEVNTFQDPDRMQLRTCIRIAVELEDRQKNTYVVNFTAMAPDSYDSEYLGEDYWFLYMPYGDMDRLKISASAVQYGVMDEDVFVPFVSEYDDVETIEELRKRTTTPLPGKVSLKHYYMFDDQVEGSMESILRTLRAVE